MIHVTLFIAIPNAYDRCKLIKAKKHDSLMKDLRLKLRVGVTCNKTELNGKIWNIILYDIHVHNSYV